MEGTVGRRADHRPPTNLGSCASSVSLHLRACPSAFSTGTARWPRSRATPSAGSPSPAPATPQADVRLLSPILPSKVVGVGKNYAAHIEEMRGLTGDAPTEPLLFLKPSTIGHRPGRRHPYPAGQHERAPRGRAGRGHRRPGGPQRHPGAGGGQHLRLHDRQRRHRAGHAEERRPVDPRQGLRLLLPDRAVDRDRPSRPRPGPGRSGAQLHGRRRARARTAAPAS